MHPVFSTVDIRNVGRTLVASSTAALLAKGMTMAALADDWPWALAFAFGCCFWVVGMFKWQEEEI